MRWGQPDPCTFTGPLSDIGDTCAKRPSASLTKYTTLQFSFRPRSLVALVDCPRARESKGSCVHHAELAAV